MRGSNAIAVVATINPIVRGWAAYYRTAVSSETFASLDDYLWRLTYRWRCGSTRTSRGGGSPPATSAGSTRQGTTDGCSATATAVPTCVASPGPTSSGTRWSRVRRLRTTRPLPATGPPGVTSPDDHHPLYRRLLREQDGNCVRCGEQLLHADHLPQSPQDWEQWHRSVHKRTTGVIFPAGGPADEIRLVHTHCRIIPGRRNPLICTPDKASRTCLSRGAGKARTPGSEGAPAQ